MANELSGNPQIVDFGECNIKLINITQQFILKNISQNDITINSITFPNGFVYKIINEYPAYQLYDFKSVYQDGTIFGYNDNDIRKNITYKGFINIFNITNPIIMCNQIDSKNCFGGHLPYNSSVDFNFQNTPVYKLLKVYVPKGTTFFECRLQMSDTSLAVAISRFGKPPLKFYENENTGLDQTVYNRSKLFETKLSEEEFFIKSDSNGILNIIKYSSDIDINYGWIYIIVRSTSTIVSNIITNTVNRLTYQNADYSTFLSNGDPQESYNITSTISTPNLTGYETITYPGFRIPLDYYDFSFGIDPYYYDNTRYYFINIRKRRIFIPPGASNCYQLMQTMSIKHVVSRFQQIPTTKLDSYADITEIQAPYQISEMKKKDCVTSRSMQGNIMVMYTSGGSSIPDKKPKTIDEFIKDSSYCGWLYQEIDSDISLNIEGTGAKYINAISINVNPEIYNYWWDNYGSNSDHSINWQKDVEGLETYILPKIKHVPIVRPKPSNVNNTIYRTIHDPYYQLPTNLGSLPPGNLNFPDDYTLQTTLNFKNNISEYLTKFRFFIPPGTVNIKFNSIASQKTLSRHKTPPSSLYPLYGNYKGVKYTLKQLIEKDCYSEVSITEPLQGVLIICEDKTTVTVDTCGWIYVYSDSICNSVSFTIEIDVKLFNNWWNNYGSNTDKSINWDIDIESIETYIPKVIG